MFKKIKLYVAALLSVGLIAVPALAPVSVYAVTTDIQNNLCSGSDLNLTPGADNCSNATNGASGSLSNLLKNIINIFSILVGVVAVVMIIIGGLRYITSGGESGNVSTAKNTLIYAIVGLVIVALAQFIVHFVLGQTSTLTNGSTIVVPHL